MASPGPHDPITVTEINRAFRNSLWKVGGGRTAFMRLGFAISGGVDSMALAYLWKQLRSSKPGYNPYVQGFVVDHGLRPGSAEEARIVASRLEQFLGYPGKILTLNWNKYGGPEKVTSIETTARSLRFQALAEAAYRHGIQAILLAHHADDNIENFIHRIGRDARGSGLLGFKHVANIPECSGLYGIDNSGNFDRLQVHQGLEHYVGGPEEGGLIINRPLLDFPKTRLIATCEKAGIEWIEDKTNQDVTLTPRNVIRSLLKTDVLPMALRRESILEAINTITKSSVERQALERRFHEATHIKSFDLRSGVLDFYLPNSDQVHALLQDASEDLVFQAFARYLHLLVDYVSPDEVLEHAKVFPMATILFEELVGNSTSNIRTSSIGRVKLERLETTVIDGLDRIGMRIYRNPFMAKQKTNSDYPGSITFPVSTGNNHKSQLPTQFVKENTHLWDGRWWISVQNNTKVALRIDALNPDMLSYFKSTQYGADSQHVKNLFKEAAPSASRWTIPAIVCDSLPPRNSRIPPLQNSYWKPPIALKCAEAADSHAPVFEILKYSGKEIGPKSELRISPGKIETIPVASIDPNLFAPEENLSKRPRSQTDLLWTPKVWGSPADPAQYPMPKGPFIVAIPTMGLFLNYYWARMIRYDIRYKKIDLTDMEYVSHYRMEKPVTVNGVRKDNELPKVVGEWTAAETVNASGDGWMLRLPPPGTSEIGT